MDAIFDASYTGNGIWEVSKDCPINEVYSRRWYFYEDTGELVIKPK